MVDFGKASSVVPAWTLGKLPTLPRKWALRHPEMSDRIHRGAIIAMAGSVRPGLIPNTYMVPGSHGETYIVCVDREARTATCTCLDAKNGNHCKHHWAAALYEVLA